MKKTVIEFAPSVIASIYLVNDNQHQQQQHQQKRKKRRDERLSRGQKFFPPSDRRCRFCFLADCRSEDSEVQSGV